MSFSPDGLLDFGAEQLAYEGADGVFLADLFAMFEAHYNIKLDSFYQSIIINWIKNDDRFLLDLAKHHIKLSHDEHWRQLTGFAKENNPVGASAFQLLVEIAKSKQEGIDSLTLVKRTGQDSRSLTSRLKVLNHLVKKIAIIKNGRTLSLLILLKFVNSNHNNTVISNENSSTAVASNNTTGSGIAVNIKLIKYKIILSLKNAKNGVREINDLKRELEMDKNRRLNRVFKSFYSSLEEHGYLEKVIVVSGNQKFRCLKYIKDYIIDENNSGGNTSSNNEDDAELEDFVNDNGNDDKEFDETAIDDDLKELDDEFNSGNLSKFENNLQILPSSNNESTPVFNLVFPLQNQIFEIIDSTGTNGISSINLMRKLFGVHYSRSFTRLIEIFLNNEVDLKWSIQRNYDFNGRIKFFRYLTKLNLMKKSNQLIDLEFNQLPQLIKSNVSLSELNELEYIPLAAGVHRTDDGRILWKGYDAYKEVKKRPSAKLTEEKKLKKQKLQEKLQAETLPLQQQPQETIKSEVEEKKSNNSLKIANIEGSSFKEIERLQELLSIIKKYNGIHQLDHSLLVELRDKMGYSIDKRTFRKDIESLVSQNQLVKQVIVLEDQGTSDDEDDEIETAVEIVTLPTTSNEIIEQFKYQFNPKDEVKTVTRKLNEINNVEVDFYDNDYKQSLLEDKKLSHTKQVQPLKPNKPNPKLPLARIKPKRKGSGDIKTKIEPLDSSLSPSLESASPTVKNELAQALGLKNIEKGKKQPKPKRMARTRKLESLTSADSLRLFKAVIISKSIKNDVIEWEKISEIFDNYSMDLIQKKWPKVRMQMGPTQTKIAKRNLKKLLIQSVSNGKITIEEIETMDLNKIIKIWTDAEISGSFEESGEQLFANYEDNLETYKFVPTNDGESTSKIELFPPNSSIIQREEILTNKSFTYKEGDDVIEEESEDEKLRRMVLAVLLSGNNFEITKLKFLEKYKDQIDAIIEQMISNKEIQIHDSKLVIRDKIKSLLEESVFDFSIIKCNEFQAVLREIVSSNKALLLNKLFDNSNMVSIVELLHDRAIDLVRIDYYRKDVMTGYEARTLEREKLDCDLIIVPSEKNTIGEQPSKSVLIPIDKPCTLLWINVKGQVNKEIWNKLVTVITMTILSNPGITQHVLYEDFKMLLSYRELHLVLNWLIESKAVRVGELEALYVAPQWYLSL